MIVVHMTDETRDHWRLSTNTLNMSTSKNATLFVRELIKDAEERDVPLQLKVIGPPARASRKVCKICGDVPGDFHNVPARVDAHNWVV